MLLNELCHFQFIFMKSPVTDRILQQFNDLSRTELIAPRMVGPPLAGNRCIGCLRIPHKGSLCFSKAIGKG